MNNQQDSNMGNNDPVEIPEKQLPEVGQELSKVANSPKRSIFILVVILGGFGYLFFNLFLKNTEPQKENEVQKPSEVSKPASSPVSDVPSIPQLPDPPKLVDPLEPPPPPVPTLPVEPKATKVEEAVIPPAPLPPQNIAPPPSDNNTISSSALPSSALVDSEEEKRRKTAKRKSSIVLVAGALPTKTPEQIAQEANFQNRGNMELVLGRGKIIDAVLESSLNTDFGGEVRAVIARDVFSENGKIVLIPKGSRVFGTYTPTIEGAYGRISINWIRIDLINGYVLTFSGTGVDNLGKKGADGRVDNKYKERLANAVLLSAFNIGLANGLDKIVRPPASSHTATQNTALANTIQNGANAINLDQSLTEDSKIIQICTNTLAAIKDTTSKSYIAVDLACKNVNTIVAAAPGDKLKSVMTAITSASSQLVVNSETSATPTQAQNASKQAFTDVTNTVKDMVTQQSFKPTITIDQGTIVKIYVNQDYSFPKAAVIKSRLLQ
jgi:type IV secretion system protein VirB10